MLKAYFMDGLVQIAIVLSLLRTDLNNYLHNNYLNYPEVQEIILGPTAAYTRTNFHSFINEPEIHQKNIDAYELFASASVIRDLRSFRPVFETTNDIQTFLLVNSSNNIHKVERVEQNDSDVDDDVDGDVDSVDIEQQCLELETEGQNLINILEESIGALAPLVQSAADPTCEDLDLIEGLWREDIDLGVGKEVFDNNLTYLRHELEKESETEVQNERQKQDDNELLQQKLEEQKRHAEQHWHNDNFTQENGETGERIPLVLGAQSADRFSDLLNIAPGGEQLSQHLEATWQDIVHSLDLSLPQNMTETLNYGLEMLNVSMQNPDISRIQENSSMYIQNVSMPNQDISQIQEDNSMSLRNMSMRNQSILQIQSTSSVLIQNVTLPIPALMNVDVTMNGTGYRSPPHRLSLVSHCAESFNSSMPNGNSFGSLDWENCEDFTLANITANLSQSELIDDVNKLLPDLISKDELEDIDFDEMGLSDTLMPPSATGFGNDTSSDSAVSMGSPSAGSPEQNDLDESSPSPYDGLEGAIGGYDRSSAPKPSKYDPDDDYMSNNSCSYISDGDSNSSNFSSPSNDTSHGNSYSEGNFNQVYSPADNGHINHNHTYLQKPGTDPKHIKKPLDKDGRVKQPQSKDNKRIAELRIPFTVDHIVNSPVEEFNEMLTRSKFTDRQLQLIRDIRRRGKNKLAAQNCRKRKIGIIENLEDEMKTLEKMRDKMLRERHLLDKQTHEIKEKLGVLYSDIFHSLRDNHGQPYDPSRYSLQQSNDGDMFLVPRNCTVEDDKKRKRDRKSK